MVESMHPPQRPGDNDDDAGRGVVADGTKAAVMGAIRELEVPTASAVADRVECSAEQARRARRALEDEGRIEWTRSPADGRKRVYRVVGDGAG